MKRISFFVTVELVSSRMNCKNKNIIAIAPGNLLSFFRAFYSSCRVVQKQLRQKNGAEEN